MEKIYFFGDDDRVKRWDHRAVPQCCRCGLPDCQVMLRVGSQHKRVAT